MKDVKAEQARIRIEAARKHLTEALEAVSGPEPDWAKVRGLHGHGERCAAYGHRG